MELLEELEMGKRKRGGGDGDWREWVGYFSPWETMEAPLLEEEFARNRRISRKVKRRRVGEVLEDSGASEETSGEEAIGSQDEGEDPGTMGAEDDFQHEYEDADAGTSGHPSPQPSEDGDISIKME